jgi:hypothetical protein
VPSEEWQQQVIDNGEGSVVAHVYTEYPQAVAWEVLDSDSAVVASGVLESGVTLDISAYSAEAWIQVKLYVAVDTLDAPTPMGLDNPYITPDLPPTAPERPDIPMMSLRWMDDRERWSKERLIDLGEAGDHFPTVRFHRLGMFRSRQFELVMASPAIQCVVAFEADDEVLR